MEPKNTPRQKIIYINLDQADQPELDPEVMRWLTMFIESMGEDNIRFENISAKEPSELDELAYLDSTVNGDDHPEALGLIMDAYHKHKEV